MHPPKRSKPPIFLLGVVTLVLLSPLSTRSARAQGLVIYTKPLFAKVMPDDNPSTGTVTDEIAIVAAGEQYASGNFIAHAGGAVKNLTASAAGDLIGNGGASLSASSVDIRVVKVWMQYPPEIRIPHDQHEVLVPELLMKDDAAKANDSWQGYNYTPPSFPSRLRTDIPAGTSKEFWITVKVPGGTPGGVYKGSISLAADQGVKKSIALTVRVLPFTLPNPDKKYIMSFRGRILPGPSQEYLPKDLYVSELEDIKEHGFQGVTIYETQPAQVEEAYSRISQAGLRGPIIQMVTFLEPPGFGISPFIQIAKKYGFAPFFYGEDEPNSPDKIQIQIKKSRAIHGSSGRVVTSIDQDYNLRLNQQERLDWANIGLEENVVPAKPVPGQLQTYYWQTWTETPILHRLYSGFFLWKSGYGGVLPYVYQDFTGPPQFPRVRPYEEDYRPDILHGVVAYTKLFNTTYPAQGRPTSTLQWEALREGINDVRYLTLAQSLISQAEAGGKNDLAQNARQQITQILQPFHYSGREYAPYSLPSAGQFDSSRQSLIDLILHLRSGLGIS